MKQTSITRIAAVVLSILFLAVLAQAQTDPQPMTVIDVVRMVQTSTSPDLIILAIAKSEPHFDLTPSTANSMFALGVTRNMYIAMAERQAGKAVTVPPFPPSNNDGRPRVYLETLQTGCTELNANCHGGRDWAFLGHIGSGNHRSQTLAMASDFIKHCSGVQLTTDQSAADYTVSLNHIEYGLIARDNQFQVSARNGDVVAGDQKYTIGHNVDIACATIIVNWTGSLGNNRPPVFSPPANASPTKPSVAGSW